MKKHLYIFDGMTICGIGLDRQGIHTLLLTTRRKNVTCEHCRRIMMAKSLLSQKSKVQMQLPFSEYHLT